MFNKILVANRGEIAVRIIRACRELGIGTVAVYSEADAGSLHVQMADEAYCIGPGSPKESYLNMANIISVATLTGCEAIHPGYGFLAENENFATLVEECQLTFIGPSSRAIARMGVKDLARRTMEKAGVPIVPGSDGVIRDIGEAFQVAEKIGFPVIIKATAGGGGKGIRVARNKEELEQGIRITSQEAETAFGDPGVYIEKYIEDFRHIEIQILADHYGNVIHLGERDCTIQRRLQKLLEEAPSPALEDEIRKKMGEAAVKAAKAVDYTGAGTVEFIYDYRNRQFYFMEMNTRIQVEHPVTEMITGVDLVKEQILIAGGKPLSLRQEDVRLNGWSIECRINAENPWKNFLPSPGTITAYLPPGGPGVRVDSAAFAGYSIPPYYDSMIAKLIVHAPSRREAIERMKRALQEFVIAGIDTTIPFHLRLMEHEAFVSGTFNTKFLDMYEVLKGNEEEE